MLLIERPPIAPARPPFRAISNLLVYATEIDKLGELCRVAISGVDILVQAFELVGLDLENEHADLRYAQQRALEEEKQGHRLLLAHSVVALWGALETAIPQFCRDWLLAFPQTLEFPAFSKLRLPMSVVLEEDRTVVMEQCVEEVSRSAGAPLKVGVGRFELLLQALGIIVPLAKEERDLFFEFSKLRNVFAHQSGIADRRFVAECPSFGATVGEPVPMRWGHYHAYSGIVAQYALRVARTAVELEKQYKKQAASSQDTRVGGDE